MFEITYQAGPSRYNNYCVNWMGISPGSEKEFFSLFPDLEFDDVYAEIKIEDDDCDENGEVLPEADRRHYDQLKQEIMAKAEAHGIPTDMLKFWWD